MAIINALNSERTSDLEVFESELKRLTSKVEPTQYKIDELDHRLKTTAGMHTMKNLEKDLASWKKDLSVTRDRIDVLKRLIQNRKAAEKAQELTLKINKK